MERINEGSSRRLEQSFEESILDACNFRILIESLQDQLQQRMLIVMEESHQNLD